jgi:hypothetical protein
MCRKIVTAACLTATLLLLALVIYDDAQTRTT